MDKSRLGLLYDAANAEFPVGYPRYEVLKLALKSEVEESEVLFFVSLFSFYISMLRSDLWMGFMRYHMGLYTYPKYYERSGLIRKGF